MKLTPEESQLILNLLSQVRIDPTNEHALASVQLIQQTKAKVEQLTEQPKAATAK